MGGNLRREREREKEEGRKGREGELEDAVLERRGEQGEGR